MVTAKTESVKLTSIRYPGEDLGIWTILRGFFIIISFLGILISLTGAVPVGFAFLYALILVLLLPYTNLKLKEKTGFGITRGLKIVILIVLFVVAGQMMETKETTKDTVSSVQTQQNADVTKTTQTTDTGSSKVENQKIPQAYKLGDRVLVGDFAYTVHNYTVTNEIGTYIMGDFMGEKADGIFIILDVSIENIAKESKTILGDNIAVIDDQGRRYEHDLQAELYLPKHDGLNVAQMQPGLPKRGKIVFDVPQNIKGYLEVKDADIFSSEKPKIIRWG